MVVSKNPGGTKRVTSLADALNIGFGLVTTERRKAHPSGDSFFEGSGFLERLGDATFALRGIEYSSEREVESPATPDSRDEEASSHPGSNRARPQANGTSPVSVPHRQLDNHVGSSPLVHSTRIDSVSPPTSRDARPERSNSSGMSPRRSEDSGEEYADERAREVVTGRLVQGHLVDDDYPSPVPSAMSASFATLPGESIGPPQYENQDPMTSSFMSTISNFPSNRANADQQSDDEEEAFQHPESEHTGTFVGNVRGKIAFIVDDMIDGHGSWVAAAQMVVKRGGAKKVYCIATHGLFGGDSLEQMEKEECIDCIVVSNTYPIDPERKRAAKKLVELDLSGLLSEAIRRTHHGESISQLYQQFGD